MNHNIRNTLFVFSLTVGLLFVLLIPTGLFWRYVRPALHKDIINVYSFQYKMDPVLVMSVVRVESSFSKSARSRRGAVGLMQLMPDTALEMAEKVGRDVSVEDLTDPEVNIHLGIHYLSLLREEFEEDLVSVLAAYNAGPSHVRKWRKEGPLKQEKIPFRETRVFVKKVQNTFKWLKRFQKVKNWMS